MGNPSNIPGAREGSWGGVDANGNFWLFGGNGVDIGGICCDHLNDLWKYNPDNQEWRWVSGSNRYDQLGIYGNKGVPNSTNIPGARYIGVGWIDQNNIWLFGGAFVNDRFNDLWNYNITTNEWMWVAGSEQMNEWGNYGVKRLPHLDNNPGARNSSSGWIDNEGDLWLFGGEGYDINGNYGSLNDLWKFDVSETSWVWMSGSNIIDQPGVYGELGIPNCENVPSARWVSSNWVDACGNPWFFGGGGQRLQNDMWKFDTSILAWTWVKGDSTGYQDGIYGTLGVENSTNIPGSRNTAATFKTGDKYWLFGGYVHDANGNRGLSNDLWTSCEGGTCTCTTTVNVENICQNEHDDIVVCRPDAFTIGVDGDICYGDGFTLEAYGGSDYTWFSSDPSFLSNDQFPIVTPEDTSTYYVYIIDVENNCNHLDSVIVNVIPEVIVDFEIVRDYGDCSNVPQVGFINKTVNANNYSWSFGDGTFSSEITPEHDYISGIYTLTLNAEYEGCTDEKTITVNLQPIKTYNVITPGVMDGTNDEFVIESPRPVHLTMVNRWGKTVFESEYYENNWVAEGEAAGIYYYNFSIDGEHVCKGWVHVLK